MQKHPKGDKTPFIVGFKKSLPLLDDVKKFLGEASNCPLSVVM